MMNLKKNKNVDIVNNILKENSFLEKETPLNFVCKCYEIYSTQYENIKSINGAVFEEIIIQCLLKEGIFPIYTQVTFTFIPGIKFDLVLYRKMRPVILSIKTSLRERWKQADFEGIALKNVYRKAEVYVINNSLNENKIRNKKIDECLSIDKFIYVANNNFNELISYLKNQQFEFAKKIDVFSSFKIY